MTETPPPSRPPRKTPEKHREVKFPAPIPPAMAWRPPNDSLQFGEPRKQLVVAYTNVGAYEGELWRCDVCMAVIADYPEGHPFIDTDGLDAFERHGAWHRALVSLEQRK